MGQQTHIGFTEVVYRISAPITVTLNRSKYSPETELKLVALRRFVEHFSPQAVFSVDIYDKISRKANIFDAGFLQCSSCICAQNKIHNITSKLLSKHKCHLKQAGLMATRNAETPIMQCQDVKVDNGWEQGQSVTPPNTVFSVWPQTWSATMLPIKLLFSMSCSQSSQQ